MNDQAPKTYTIATPLDFLTIPAHRREIALSEFRNWLQMRVQIAPLIEMGLVKVPDEYVWVDDDLGEGRVNFVDAETRKPLGTLTMPIQRGGE